MAPCRIAAIRQPPNPERQLVQAARSALLRGARFTVVPKRGRSALDERAQVVRHAASEDHCIVDVVEFV